MRGVVLALGLLGCGGSGLGDPAAPECASKPGPCVALRLVGSGHFDRAVVTLSGGGASESGDVGGVVDVPTTIVLADFEGKIDPSKVDKVYVTLFGAVQVQKSAGVSGLAERHRAVVLAVP